MDRHELLSVLAAGKVRRVDKPWGYEVIVETDEFLIKHITINEGHRTSLQYHEVKDEVIIPYEGDGRIEVAARTIRPGDGPVRVTPGTVHRTFGPLVLLEVTTPHDDDVVRLEDSYGRTT